MFSQYRNKIIAFFVTVCLLVTSLCVPVEAVDSSTTGTYAKILPWGVYCRIFTRAEYQAGIQNLDDFVLERDCINFTEVLGGSIPSTESDKVSFYIDSQTAPTSKQIIYAVNSNLVHLWGLGASIGSFSSPLWFCLVIGGSSTDSGALNYVYPASFISDGSLWATNQTSSRLSLSSVVRYTENSNYFESESPVMDVVATTTGESSIHTDFAVSGLSSTDSLYTISASCFAGDALVGSSAVGPYSGPEFQTTVSVDGLSPSTEYTVEYQLSKDGEYTGVSQTVTVTTAADSGSGSGDGTGDGGGNSGSCTECPSILSAILSAITNQSTFLIDWKQDWISRMDSLETTLSKLIPVPDPVETALKESVKETTKEVTDTLFADDSPTKVTASDVKDVASSGKAVINTFDTGTSVGDFFSVFADYTFTGWFSEQTRSNLDTVNSVSLFGIDNDPYNHDSYNKNMEALDKFLERS